MLFFDFNYRSDWYATFCELGGGDRCTGWGADPTGEVVPGIVPVESVPLWSYLVGDRHYNDSVPHPVLHLSPIALLQETTTSLYKILAGIASYTMLTGPSYPNCTVCKHECLCSPNQTQHCR
jgi:hypothetical protein